MTSFPWKNKKVLVTGAGGFIGSHLSEALAEQGARVRAFVHYRGNGQKGWLEQSPVLNDLEVIAGDVRDTDCVSNAVKGMDVVFHLAALIGIPYSYHAPESYVQTNVMGTLNVLRAARSFEIEKLIHTSTSEVYGTARYVPIDEIHPLQGQSPYSASKIGGDKLAESFYLSFHLPVVTVRPFNTFGPRQSSRAVIPTIISQCLTGQTVRLGNLRPTRDLNYVSNSVEGFLKAAERPQAVGQTINLGSGREIAVGDLAQAIAKLCGTQAQVQTDPERLRPENSEVERLLANNALAKQLLDWSPAVSLEEGLSRTIEWLRPNLNLYRPRVYAI